MDIHKLIREQKVHRIKIYLINNGPDVDAFHYAVKTGRTFVVSTFLEFVDVDVRDERGYTALRHAVENSDDDMVRFLIRHGASVDISRVDSRVF